MLTDFIMCFRKLKSYFHFSTSDYRRELMGTNNSKENHDLTSPSTPPVHSSTVDTNSKWRSSTNNTNKLALLNKKTDYHGWQEISRCSHAEWLHGISEQFGFAQHTFTCSSELHAICAPGFCSESLSRKLHHGYSRSSSKKFQQPSRFNHHHSGQQRRSLLRPSSSSSSSTKSKKLREHFEYNHIPAMISSLQNYSVHGIINGCSMSTTGGGDTIMLLIYSVVLDKTKFIIVDLKLNRYVCALGDDYNGLIPANKVHAAWSMDRTQVIIRVPVVGGCAALDFYTIVKKESKLRRRIVPVDVHTQFVFCPNYWTSRLAMYNPSTHSSCTLINFNMTTSPGGSNKIQTQTIPLYQQSIGCYLNIIDVPSWSIIENQSLSIDDGFQLLSLLYTPDSAYLILTLVDVRCHCGQTLPISCFDIYDGNTLVCLHRIHTQLISHICPWHMCRNLLTPIFSASSSRMAFCTTKNNGGRELQVAIIVLPNELNLKAICRRVIVHYLHELDGKADDITGELPYRLSQYIQYRPQYQ